VVRVARKLTPKQKLFCDYYIETGNATEAALKAGYSSKTARSIGAENLTKPYIKEAIKIRNKEIESKRIANMKEVKEFWTALLRNTAVEPRDRLKASEYIAKTNGAFLDKVEHSGSVTINNPFAGLTTEEIRQLIADED
jgi:phage terminase small subunit